MDKDVWQSIINGDTVAYERLYFHYYKKFYNYGRKYTSDTLLIEDSIQDVFLDIWNNRIKILEVASPTSYFFSAFRYILLKKLRLSSRVIPIGAMEEPDFLISLATASGEAGFDLKQRLQAALNTLTSRQKEAVFLRFYEGLSYEDVAAVLDISVKATYKIMAKSLRVLKDSLSLSSVIILLLLRVFCCIHTIH